MILHVDSYDETGCRHVNTVLSVIPARVRPLEWQLVSEIKQTQKLLAEVFPRQGKYAVPGYLQWEYEGSPSGKAIQSNEDDQLGRFGHYGLVPQRWVVNGERALYALSLNTAVSERARGRGVFTRLAGLTYEAARRQNVQAVIAVANRESTHGFTASLGFDLIGQLPVVVHPKATGSGWKELEVISRSEFTELLDEPNWGRIPDSGVWRRWGGGELAWRLADPAHQYMFVVDQQAAAVVHCFRQFGLRIAVIVKVFVRNGAVLDLGPFARRVARLTRSTASLYAGINPAVRVAGPKIPARFRPSPLNFVVKSLVDGVPAAEFVPSEFEFLDFDAY